MNIKFVLAKKTSKTGGIFYRVRKAKDKDEKGNITFNTLNNYVAFHSKKNPGNIVVLENSENLS